ncbi:MAG: proteobacterial dedicated sortase system response regulator [Pseudomonadota bacterium]|nr:proteobacterial dedicated sortase system response regulator [Pseudomonadota bacterium]
MGRTIAIVEDEALLRENYADAMRGQGYDVDCYADRPLALAAFRARLPDLAIIDVGLGDEVEGGFELCRELRSLSDTVPIIFLSARDSDLDAVSGLRLGADDYLTKDISTPHLLARITALFRRLEAMSKPNAGDGAMHRGQLEIEPDRMIVRWDGHPIALTVTEFWLIHDLARFPGHVKSREQLMRAASIVVDDHTVTTHIKRIRRKFSHIEPGFRSIETVYGAGYRWVE